jgi:DNA invertase Pin-like site-specific DNA recombinase
MLMTHEGNSSANQGRVYHHHPIFATQPNYVHQMLLMEEFERGGCQLEFIDQPMSQTPHDQLLVQIRGAVAEYERSLIAERMRRGR